MQQTITDLRDGQEVLHILRNLNVHYRIYKSQTFIHILSQINPVHTSHPNAPCCKSESQFTNPLHLH
jgi:hypothetical protein